MASPNLVASVIVLVGLGNPGQQYALNRHNIGFMAIDSIAQQHEFPEFKKKFNSYFSEKTIGSAKVILLKPQTFMNLSGKSIGQVMQFYKLKPEQIYVFHDELDLAPGRIRFKTGGGNSGHNGLKSIDSLIGTKYHRIRLGIGRPLLPGQVTSYVLSNFNNEDELWLIPLLAALSVNLKSLLKGSATDWQNKVYVTMQKLQQPEAASNAD